MNLNVTTLRSWSAVVTDTLYGLLAIAIFSILIPELAERGALSRLEVLGLGFLFAVLAGSHIVTAALNATALARKNRVAH
jgi:hypothetical protein